MDSRLCHWHCVLHASQIIATFLSYCSWPGVMKPVEEYGPSGGGEVEESAAPASKPADDDDSDFDPFASDNSEVFTCTISCVQLICTY